MTRDQQVQFIRDAVQHAMRVVKAGETRKIGRTGEVTPTAAQPEPLSCRNQGAQGAATLKGSPNGPITSAVGAGVRNDRVNEVSARDTNKRIDVDVGETAAVLGTRKVTRMPTHDEIVAAAGDRNVRGVEEIVALMRAQRKLNGTE